MSKKSKRLRAQSSQQISQPSQQSEQALAQQAGGIIRQEFSGPLPPPEVLEKYNEVIPDGAERIMKMAEEQGKHRRQLEARALNTDSRNSLLGVIFAFMLGLTTVITGAIVVSKGYSYSGTFLGSAGLFGLVYAFIYGTRERRKERESKARKS